VSALVLSAGAVAEVSFGTPNFGRSGVLAPVEVWLAEVLDGSVCAAAGAGVVDAGGVEDC
jgi:hypothetical protein